MLREVRTCLTFGIGASRSGLTQFSGEWRICTPGTACISTHGGRDECVREGCIIEYDKNMGVDRYLPRALSCYSSTLGRKRR